jgi:WD40 repeat protein/serine/threonine protein kinase
MTERSIFLAVLEIEDRAARSAYLDRACAGDPALRSQVERLLQAHQEPGPFMERPAPALVTTVDEPLTERPGTVIGPYKLREQLGEGGMGLVFVAEQQQPVRRKVALKVIKPGMDSQQVIARFEAERQALALMDHPHIAKVHDGGTTASGRPYFVMELVKGVPITAYCDQNRLTPRQRLELFLPVCQAVQHAHQKGIIHRDLKPSNVLVTVHDVQPVPKVIDFGVAKAIGQKLTDQTLYTGIAQLVGTPLYMSPEQAGFSGLDVDTRSDIYSLGVLLYELLTGLTPFDQDTLRKAGYDEMRRIIREDEPPKPSTRLSTLEKGKLSTICEQRGVESRKLSQQVRGELDWIVMKALEKDRIRRYESSSAFAADVLRYLNDEPVQACPPSAGYRLRKFVRRNKGAAVYALLLLVVALSGLGSMVTWLWRSAVEARQDAVEARTQTEIALEKEQEARSQLEKILSLHRVAMAQRAYEDDDLLRARVLLNLCPVRLRHWEWHYVHRLCHTELLNFAIHDMPGSVRTMAFSPDGRRLTIATQQEGRTWDLATGQHSTFVIGDTQEPVRTIAFSPDRRSLTAVTNREVRTWDLATGQNTLDAVTGKQDFLPIALSPDRKHLAAVRHISDPKSGRTVEAEVRLSDATTGQEIVCLKGHKGSVSTTVYSPDGTRLACASGDGVVNLLDTQSGLLIRTLRGHTGRVLSAAFSGDGTRLATGSADKTAQVWHVADGEVPLTLAAHSGGVSSVAFSPDGTRLATGSDDMTAKIWDLATAQDVRTLRGHERGVCAVGFSPDGQHLATSDNEIVKVWNAVPVPRARTLIQEGFGPMPVCLAFSPDGRRLVTDLGETEKPSGDLKLWDATTGQEVLTLKGHSDAVFSVAFAPDGRRLASASRDRTVKIWDMATAQTILTLRGHADAVWGVAFSRDGTRLATASADRSVKVWDARTGLEIHALWGHTDQVRSACFSPDGTRLASAADDGIVNLWDAQTGRLLCRLLGHSAAAVQVCFSPDGKQLASCSRDRTVKVWDVAVGWEVHSLEGHADHVCSVAFSPDGTRLASASADKTIKLWDPFMGEEALTLRRHTNTVVGLAFSPDGWKLASLSWDRTVRDWDATPRPARWGVGWGLVEPAPVTQSLCKD